MDFALRFDLLKEDEVAKLRLVKTDYGDIDDIEASIPRCACSALGLQQP